MARVEEIGRLGGARPGFARIAAFLTDRSEAGASRRFAAFAFAARVGNAGLGFATQILLARWMGERDYGIYSSVWIWVLVAGGVLSLGLPVAALKFVPDYRERCDLDGLRGFLSGSRRLGILPGLVTTAAGLVAVAAFRDELGPYGGAAAVALVTLPVYVLTDIQTGIARASDYADLGLMADYLLRPILLLGFVGGVALAVGTGTPGNVMAATLGAVLVTALVQGVLLQRRLGAAIPAGPRRPDLARWASVCWPLLTVTGFTLLLGAVDLLVLQLFVPPEEIAVYFAATKIVAVASFVSYGVSNTSAHRFSAQIARGDRAGMARFAADTVRWTFWPTLAVALALSVLSLPLLRLFGAGFASGVPLVCILAAGLVAGAVVGPADRALAMADHGGVTARIYGATVVANALFCVALVPVLGLAGAALGTALANALKAALLFVATRKRLGIAMSILTPPGSPP